MKMDELERMIYEQVWSEESEKEDGAGADGWNGKDGVRKRRRNSWRLLKQVIPARGYVRYENSVFRVEQRQHGQLVIAPKHRYVRITARGRKFVEEAKEIPVMCYEEFFERFLKYSFDATTVNGRVSGVQRKFLESIAQEGVLPCTGDMRRC